MSKDKLRELLGQLWLQDISADEAFDELEDLINRITQLEQENNVMRADLLLWNEKEAKP
jgi:uncharacterized protein (UPF0335 family)